MMSMTLCIVALVLRKALFQVEKQQRLDPKPDYKPLAPVLDNSAIWGTFMAVSTNLRYQLVNCIEDRGLVRISLDAFP